jgi:hypothetical protein
MPQKPQVRARDKARQTRRLAVWRKKRDAQAAAQQPQQSDTQTEKKA